MSAVASVEDVVRRYTTTLVEASKLGGGDLVIHSSVYRDTAASLVSVADAEIVAYAHHLLSDPETVRVGVELLEILKRRGTQ